MSGSPETTHAYCPGCRQQSAIDWEDNCLWCGGPTSNGKKRGKPSGVHGRLSDEQLRSLYDYHRRGISIRELGRRIRKRIYFASDKSAAMAISDGFKRLSLEARQQSKATADSNRRRGSKDSPGTADRSRYKAWLRKKKGGMRPCQGVKSTYPEKGRPCRGYAQFGSEFCLHHDPERRSEVLEAVERARLAAESEK